MDGGQTAENMQAQSFKARRKEQLQKELMLNALHLFEEKGFDSVAVDDIVRATGVAKGTFYLYFRSKADVVVTIIENAIKELEAQVAESVALAPRDAAKTLRAALQTFLAFFERHPAMVPLLLSQRGISTKELPDDTREDLSIRYRRATSQVFETVLRQGMLQGVFREVDAEKTAQALFWLVAGYVQESKETENLSNVLEDVLDIFENGIKRQAGPGGYVEPPATHY